MDKPEELPLLTCQILTIGGPLNVVARPYAEFEMLKIYFKNQKIGSSGYLLDFIPSNSVDLLLIGSLSIGSSGCDNGIDAITINREGKVENLDFGLQCPQPIIRRENRVVWFYYPKSTAQFGVTDKVNYPASLFRFEDGKLTKEPLAKWKKLQAKDRKGKMIIPPKNIF